MQSFDLYEAKTHFSELIESTEKGETFFISKRGKPVGRLVLFHSLKKQQRVFAFAKGLSSSIHDDFDRMGEREISRMFYGE